jgi:hypothetical protein
MENTSGQGKAAVVPAEVARWNWGAFLLNVIWGIGNKTYIALLGLVPFVNVVMPFVLGAKGSAWAWRNKRWDSVEHFQRVQRKWALWGVVVVVAVIGTIAALFFSITSALKDSEAFQLGMGKLQGNAEAMSALGAPISTGFPMGSLKISDSRGKADLSFSVEGSKAKGTLYLDASRDLGVWKMNRIALEVEGRKGRIDLNAVAKPVARPQAAPASPPSAAAEPTAAETKPVVAPAAPAPKSAEAAIPQAPPVTDQPQPVAVPPVAESAAKPDRVARAASNRLAPNADLRKCLELTENAAVIKCVNAYR